MELSKREKQDLFFALEDLDAKFRFAPNDKPINNARKFSNILTTIEKMKKKFDVKVWYEVVTSEDIEEGEVTGSTSTVCFDFEDAIKELKKAKKEWDGAYISKMRGDGVVSDQWEVSLNKSEKEKLKHLQPV
jgi:hypothetical protein